MEFIRIAQLIKPYVDNKPDAPALIGTDGQTLTYGQMDEAITSLTADLNLRGIKNNQRVATIIDNSIDMVVTFFALSNIASLVPLSPDFSEEQYRYYLDILKIDYLLAEEGSHNIATKIAADLKLPVILLNKTQDNSKRYHLTGAATGEYQLNLAQEDDTAMVLFTSGTTSLPKIVPRTQDNLFWSAQIRKMEMELTSEDRVLLTSPIYRGISLNDATTILSAGGTVIFDARLQPDELFSLLATSTPTWLIGTPVVFYSLAEYAEKNKMKNNYKSLRAIRSSGAPLAEELAARLKHIFGVPIYTGYGMTEAGNISSTQNSPQGLKKGSVGVPAGIETKIMDENGVLLDRNVTGEIVVRGPQVIKGYDNEDEINKASFHGEWFRTGDSGYLDEDGYLYVIGRYKEIINRGGEKVSPYEVEAALSEHPDILQTAVFPIPAEEGLEEVGAAVVLREDSTLYLKDLRRFLNGKVTAFKMPSQLYVLSGLPVSDAGKVQRRKLYGELQTMGVKPQPLTDMNEGVILPRDEVEKKLYKIFKKILSVKRISVTDTFFELGGDSLKSAILFNQIEKAFQMQIPLKHIFNNGSIESLAEYIDNVGGTGDILSFAVPFQTQGGKTPLFFVHSTEGEAVVYKNLTINFDPKRPIYGISFNPQGAKWKHPLTFEQIAQAYIKDITTLQPHGPYILAGQCVGGIIAYEIARQLEGLNQQVSLLAMFDPIIPGTEVSDDYSGKLQRNINEIKEQGVFSYLKTKRFYYGLRIQTFLYKSVPDSLKPWIFSFIDKNSWIRYGRSVYQIRPYEGEMIYLKPDNGVKGSSDNSIRIWSEKVGNIKVVSLIGEHDSVLFEENAENTRRVLEGLLENIQ